jgi:hypothetical protein
MPDTKIDERVAVTVAAGTAEELLVGLRPRWRRGTILEGPLTSQWQDWLQPRPERRGAVQP